MQLKPLYRSGLLVMVFLARSLVIGLEPPTPIVVHEALVTPAQKALSLQAFEVEPPALPIEERGAAVEGAEWIPGYWEGSLDGKSFIFTPGLWRYPPPEKRWISGCWIESDAGWIRLRGYWTSHVDEEYLVPIAPPERLVEAAGEPPTRDSFWAPGYWECGSSAQSFQWVQGLWKQIDPEWIFTPGYWAWKPDGYFYVSATWDYPLERRGAVKSEASWQEVTNSLLTNYPDYLCFFQQHYLTHESYWRGNLAVPPWWRWSNWWTLPTADHWALFWWWSHPGYPHPEWLTIGHCQQISAAGSSVVARMKGVAPPFIVDAQGSVLPSTIIASAQKEEPVLLAMGRDAHPIKPDAAPAARPLRPLGLPAAPGQTPYQTGPSLPDRAPQLSSGQGLPQRLPVCPRKVKVVEEMMAAHPQSAAGPSLVPDGCPPDVPVGAVIILDRPSFADPAHDVIVVDGGYLVPCDVERPCEATRFRSPSEAACRELVMREPFPALHKSQPVVRPVPKGNWWQRVRCGRIGVGGEMLFMQASRPDLTVATVDHRPYVPFVRGMTPPESTEQIPPVGTVKRVNPHFRFGFRVTMAYLFPKDCCLGELDIIGNYTWFQSVNGVNLRPDPGGTHSGGLWIGFLNDSDPLTDPFNAFPFFTQQVLFDSTNSAVVPAEANAFVSSKVRFDYNSADLDLGYHFRKWALSLRSYFGLHFANLDLFFTESAIGTLHPGVPLVFPAGPMIWSRIIIGGYHQHNQSWGIGPKIGIGGRLDCLYGFGVAGRVGVALLAGERHSKLNTFYQAYSAQENGEIALGGPLDNLILNTPGSRESIVSPELDARLGISYDLCLWRQLHLSAEAGWEIISYVNFAEKGPSYRVDRGLLGDTTDSFNLSGLYLRLTATF